MNAIEIACVVVSFVVVCAMVWIPWMIGDCADELRRLADEMQRSNDRDDELVKSDGHPVRVVLDQLDDPRFLIELKAIKDALRAKRAP